jgi:hypothetical protein
VLLVVLGNYSSCAAGSVFRSFCCHETLPLPVVVVVLLPLVDLHVCRSEPAFHVRSPGVLGVIEWQGALELLEICDLKVLEVEQLKCVNSECHLEVVFVPGGLRVGVWHVFSGQTFVGFRLVLLDGSPEVTHLCEVLLSSGRRFSPERDHFSLLCANHLAALVTRLVVQGLGKRHWLEGHRCRVTRRELLFLSELLLVLFHEPGSSLFTAPL